MVPVHGGAGGATRVVSGKPGRMLGNMGPYEANASRQHSGKFFLHDHKGPVKGKHHHKFEDDREKYHREIDVQILKEYVKRQLSKLRGVVRAQEG